MTRSAASCADDGTRPTAAFDALPPERPLVMPVQSLVAAPDPRPVVAPTLWGRRALLLAVTVLITAAAVSVLFHTFAADRLTLLEMAQLPLFASLFAWTTFSCASAAAGFACLWREARRPAAPPSRPLLAGRNAILAPVYDEAPGPVLARLEAMLDSLDRAGGLPSFDLFILSDTRDARIAAAEHAGFRRLRARFAGRARVFYRRRAENTERKAGNIADWVRRFGAAYAHMVVLDADSLMTGDRLVGLAAAMEASPGVGLIQTTPLIVNGRTLFARIEQFASRLYGPMFARGLEWWSGAESSYWGHNAIIRVRAFAEQAGLPHLPGPRPIGGAIMSHDFVEAALIRRAGWEVRLSPEPGGSYEESPPTLIDQIVRDRRWCQGNLQHVGVVAARGLHPLSRFHLLRGFSSYLTAPLWLGLLTVGLLLASFPVLGGTAWAVSASPAGLTPALWTVLGLSVAMLLAPKVMALAVVARQGGLSGFGGGRRALAGSALETAITALIAPVVLFAQSRALVEIVQGRDSGWAAQRRAIDRLSLREALMRHKAEAVFGLGLIALSLAFEPAAFPWVAIPAVALTFAFAVSSLTARDARGLGLLVTPETSRPPAVLLRALELSGAPLPGLTPYGPPPRPAPGPRLLRPAPVSAALAVLVVFVP